jgi:hypothetical protein
MSVHPPQDCPPSAVLLRRTGSLKPGGVDGEQRLGLQRAAQTQGVTRRLADRRVGVVMAGRAWISARRRRLSSADRTGLPGLRLAEARYDQQARQLGEVRPGDGQDEGCSAPAGRREITGQLPPPKLPSARSPGKRFVMLDAEALQPQAVSNGTFHSLKHRTGNLSRGRG